MRFRQHLGFGYFLLIAAAIHTACGEEAGKAPEPASGGDGGSRGGKGGKGGSGGSKAGGTGGDAGDGGSAGDGSSNGGAAGESGGTAGTSGKGGSSGTAGTGPTAMCEDSWSEPNTSTACDIYALPMNTTTTLTGNIMSDVTLTSGNAYRLDGPTRLMNDATLTIQPCVRIEGQDPTSVLAVLPGSTLDAEGEEDRPIVFTSAEAEGSRGPGDWGGIIILGNARVSNATATQKAVIEGLVGLTEEYGYHTDEFNDESSGTLAYVRVEFVGYDIDGAGNETNGISFGGVGSGTRVHHVMVSNSIDDCFEWFGGTMSADHLIAFNCDDDMFDTDTGFGGTVQFAFGRMFPTSVETDAGGFEMDSKALSPATTAQWSNVTLCGNNERDRLRIGMVLRTGLAGSITNALVTGFHGGAVARRDASPVTLTHMTSFGNDMVLGAEHTGGSAWLSDQEGNSAEAPDGFCDCWADPPNPFPIAPIPGGAPPAGAVDPDANYVGAFEDATPENNWMTGKWVDWAEQ